MVIDKKGNIMEQIYIDKGNNTKLAKFLEQICNRNLLYNYIGAMDMAIESALNLVSSDATLTFSHHKDGVCFNLTAQSPVFHSLSNIDSDITHSEYLFLIKHLTDKINISEDGKTMELFFSIDGIETELVMHRKEKFKAYSFRKVAVVQ